MKWAGPWSLLGLVVAIAIAVVGVVAVRAATEDEKPQEAVPAKPRTEQVPKPTAVPDIAPPPTLPDVNIPPIPEVDEDPFKAGKPPRREGPSGLLAEGKRLFNREGRLETDSIGRSIFVFDSGAPPMYLLENSWREFVEGQTEQAAKLARWRVSGLVTIYGKRNYLLLTKCARIEAEEDQL